MVSDVVWANQCTQHLHAFHEPGIKTYCRKICGGVL